MKILYCDIETTGLNPEKHSIIQCAGMIIENGRELDRFDYLIRPGAGREIDQKALAVNGRTVEEINNFPLSPNQLTDVLRDKLVKNGKMFFVAYNAKFDFEFLEDHFLYFGGEPFFRTYFYWPYLCAMEAAAWKLCKERHMMKDFKQTTVAAKLGIEFTGRGAHDALSDILVTRDIVKICAGGFLK